jgi:hypothetical protein
VNVTKKIETQVAGIPAGIIFGYAELGLLPEEYVAAAKALERLVRKGTLRRFETGAFYRPKITLFGKVGPSEADILRSILFFQGKQVAYVTGTALYNQMGLTTQIPHVIEISGARMRAALAHDSVRTRLIKSRVEVTGDNVSQLELLDAFKDFKHIPDLDRSQAIRLLSARIQGMHADQLDSLGDYARAYPPRTSALLGAVLDFCGKKSLAARIMSSLNPLTKFRLGVSATDLPTAPQWNIE